MGKTSVLAGGGPLPVVLLGLAMAGCGGAGDEAPESLNGPRSSHPAAKRFSLGCTIPTFGHPFFVAMKKGLDEEAAKLGAEINVVDGKDSSQEQLTAIDNFLVQKVDAIVLCPTETDTLIPGVEKANAQNVPVITVNRTVAGGKVVTYVGADDREGGRLQGRAVLAAIPSGGRIVLLQGILGSSPQRDREAGLEEVLKDHPNHKIVQKIPYDFQRRIAVDRVQALLLEMRKGQLDVIVAQSDDGALAAADVCARSGRTEIKIVGFNGESDAFDGVKAGRIFATVLQDAETQGREAVKATLAHLKGETVKNPMITPLHLVTKENVGDYRPAWISSGAG